MFNTRLRAIVRVSLFSLLCFTLLRLVFLATFNPQFRIIPLGELVQALYIGLRLDLRLMVLIVLPFFLLSLIPGLGYDAEHPGPRKFWLGYFTTVWMFVFIIYSIDFGYYAYLLNRLDASVIAFLQSPLTSFMMVWESYPLIPGLLALAAIGFGSSKLFKWVLLPVAQKSQTPWIVRFSSGLLVFVLLGGIGYGKWSRYPLRWSDAFFSTDQPANQLALNPVLYFVNTFNRRRTTYDLDQVKQYYPVVANWLRIPDSARTPLNYSRRIGPDSSKSRPLNVVMIFLETFPVYKVGAYGNPMGASPNFDRLSRDGINFTNYFVPKFSTAASIFSALTGLPDVAVIDRSTTRDPYAISQHLLMNDLTRYRKHFFIGGSANWGDVGGFFRNNVKGIQIHQEGGYSVAETNAWGISDYDLMEAANRVMKAEKQPFFTVLLTAGHHPPYSIPTETPGFERIQFSEAYYKNGFNSENELNAFRYMDFAVGHLMELAQPESYFQNTLFVMFGDHGFSHSLKPEPQGDLSLDFYHVPLLIYGPGAGLKPRTIDRVVSEIDIMPTIMGFLGVPYTNTALGRDIFGPAQSMFPSAFMFSPNSAAFGLLYDSYYFVAQTPGTGKLVLPGSADPARDVQSRYGPEFNQLEELARGILSTAQYLRYHNQVPIQARMHE